jgi:hypothetical protein
VYGEFRLIRVSHPLEFGAAGRPLVALYPLEGTTWANRNMTIGIEVTATEASATGFS